MKGFGKSETLTTLEIPATSTDTAFRLAAISGYFRHHRSLPPAWDGWTDQTGPDRVEMSYW